MAESKQGPLKWAFSHDPDALDLLRIEGHIEALEKKRAELATEISLIPGRRRAKLQKLDDELGRLRWQQVRASEHVRSNRVQSEIYEAQRREVCADKASAIEMEDRRAQELAQSKLQEIRSAQNGSAETPGDLPPQTAKDRRAALQSFLQQRKNLSRVEQQVARSKLLEDERKSEA